MYTFHGQLRAGSRGEQTLDAVFAADWMITPATDAEQRQGVDRHFQHRTHGQRWTVEYKTDYAAGRTHNAFLETISVDATNKPGWVYTCQADWVLYFAVGEGLVYWCRPVTLQHYVRHLAHWRRPVSVPNRDYRTWGYCVPLRVLERIAGRIDAI